MINTILFDLDGTLLPLEQEEFIDYYFKQLIAKFYLYGYEPGTLLESLKKATEAMVMNDGSLSNENVFWIVFQKYIAKDITPLKAATEDFYRHEFSVCKSLTEPTKLAGECVKMLREKGYQLVLATNPLFPQIATYIRMEWAGISKEDFSLITTYEMCNYSKPNLDYYRFILKTIGKSAEECLMVGNDVEEDMCAGEFGMDTYLLTDCMLNEKNKDITTLQKGTFQEFYHYIQALPWA